MKRKQESAAVGGCVRRASLAMGLVAGLGAVDCAAQHVPIVVYGRLHLSVERLQAGGPAAVERTEYKNNTSRFGFRGSYDAGNDFYAFYQLESGAAADGDGLGTGSNTNGGRETFVGFGNTKAGSIKVGNFYHPYDDLHYVSGNYWQLFTGTSNDATLWANGSNAATGGFDQRLANGASYYTPNWNGFQGKIWYSLTQGPGGEEALGKQGSKVLSMSLTYDKAGTRLAWGYYGIDDAKALSANFYDKGSSHFITGGITFGGLYLAGCTNSTSSRASTTPAPTAIASTSTCSPSTRWASMRSGRGSARRTTGKAPPASPTAARRCTRSAIPTRCTRAQGVYALYTKLENDAAGPTSSAGARREAPPPPPTGCRRAADQPAFVLGGFVNFQWPN
jgi:predicted porin